MSRQIEGDLLAIAILLGRDISRPLSTHAVPYEVTWEEVLQKFGITIETPYANGEVSNAFALWKSLIAFGMRPVLRVHRPPRGANSALVYPISTDEFIDRHGIEHGGLSVDMPRYTVHLV